MDYGFLHRTDDEFVGTLRRCTNGIRRAMSLRESGIRSCSRNLMPRSLAAILDAGPCPESATTVIDMTSGTPEVIRVGTGSLERLGLSA